MELTRDAILAADDLTLEPLEVPEWGGTVYVRGLCGRDRDSYELRLAVARQRGQVEDFPMRAEIAVRCLVDSAGNRLFGPGDVSALAEKSADVLDRVYDKAARLSGMEPEAVEEEGKGSPPAPGGDSPTD